MLSLSRQKTIIFLMEDPFNRQEQTCLKDLAKVCFSNRHILGFGWAMGLCRVGPCSDKEFQENKN